MRARSLSCSHHPRHCTPWKVSRQGKSPGTGYKASSQKGQGKGKTSGHGGGVKGNAEVLAVSAVLGNQST
jgi:hypothetical protein